MDEAKFREFAESCPVKAAMSGAVGGAMGGLFGMFMGSIDFSSASEHAGKRIWHQVAIGYKDMFKRAQSSAKTFAVFGAVYSASECAVESYRGKSDIVNSIAGGCLTGGIMASKAGPLAAAGGCASVAAFSAAIDYYFHDR